MNTIERSLEKDFRQFLNFFTWVSSKYPEYLYPLYLGNNAMYEAHCTNERYRKCVIPAISHYNNFTTDSL